MPPTDSAKIKLYGTSLSTPTRLVHMTLETVNIPYEFIHVDRSKGEHQTKEFTKINPNQTLPALVDGDFSLGESRPAATYVAEYYDRVGNLYPKDIRTRAKVDEMLFFDAGNLFKAFEDAVSPELKGLDTLIPSAHPRFYSALSSLCRHLAPTGFVAATRTFSVADLAVLATYSSAKETGAFQLDSCSYPEVEDWFLRMKSLVPSYQEICGRGAKAMGELYRSKKRPVQIYGMPLSPPSRLLVMTAESLGMKYQYNLVDLFKGEHKKPGYLELNPNGTVPTLADGAATTVANSRPAALYLCNAYGRDGGDRRDIYPGADPRTRASIDQAIYFDAFVFYPAIGGCVYPITKKHEPMADDAHEKLEKALQKLEDMLERAGGRFVAGTAHWTLADLCLVASYSSAEAALEEDMMTEKEEEEGGGKKKKYPNIDWWFQKMKQEIPFYDEICGSGARDYGKWYKEAKENYNNE